MGIARDQGVETLDSIRVAFGGGRHTLWALYRLLEDLHIVSGIYSHSGGQTTLEQDGRFVERFEKHG